MTVWINVDSCDACGRCIASCPYEAMMLQSNEVNITNKCTECGICVNICKRKAIITDFLPRSIPDFSNYKDVWTFIEHDSNNILNVSIEALGKAQELSSTLQQKTVALILGYNLSSNFVKKLEKIGADTILVVDNKKLKFYDAKFYTSIIKDIVEVRKPNIFLFGSTYIGRDLAPRIAKSITAGLTADCTELAIDPIEKNLIQTRPAFGGNVLATIVNRFSRPQMATVRAGVMHSSNKSKNKNVLIEYLPCKTGTISTKIIKIVESKENHVALDKAKIVISGGRGMKNKKGFDLLYKLASMIDGEVAGTRVAVENGWISEKKQVGQTGQTIKPRLYIACGISGAIQHRAGIMNSKFIIAINNDPHATIFKTANWGIIGDVFQVLPELIRHIKTKLRKDKIYCE